MSIRNLKQTIKKFALWLCAAALLAPMAPALAAPTVNTTTALASATNPVDVGSPTVLTATVTGTNPSGNVAFKSGTTTMGTVALSGTGNTRTASYSAIITTVGAKSLTAVYAGDTTNITSTSAALAQTVSKLATSTSLVSATNPVAVGTPTVLTATVTGYSPTGNVAFKNGATTMGTVALSGTGNTRTATYSATITAAGAKSLTAVYAGNTNNLTSISAEVAQTVDKLNTSATLASSLQPATQGQSITFTASVTGYNPTGNVVFKDGATTLSTKALSGAGNTRTATYANTTLAAGVHSITLDYVGNANNNISSAAALTQTINAKAVTSTALTSGANPSTFGQSIELTASVTGGDPESPPSGSVTFKNGTATLGTGTVSAGVASLSTSALAVGSRSLTAVYAGDTLNSASTSAAVTQVVNKATSSTVLSSSANPSSVGGSITLSAAVSGATPTGTVTFKDGTTTLGTGTITAGVATLATSALAAGTHSLTAVYAGNTNNLASTSAVLSQSITTGTTTSTTALTSSDNPSTFGQSITLTATVSGAGPTGTVTFKNGSATLGSGTLAAGVATFTTSALATGSRSLTAVYGGDAMNAVSTSAALTQLVSKVASSTTLSSSANPSTVGSSVTLSAAVTGATPTGTVTFKDGTATLGTGTIAAGVATFTTSALATGMHSITAVYAGNANNTSSTSAVLSQNVDTGGTATTTSLDANPNPSTSGQVVALTAFVSGTAPSGTVTFKEGLQLIGTASLSCEVPTFASKVGPTLLSAMSISTCNATFFTSSLTAGGHNITAEYGGDINNAPSASSSVMVSVVLGDMVWQYGYDAMGRLTSALDPNGLPSYTYYDSLGRPIQRQEPANVGAATPTVTEYAYNQADSLTKVTDPRNLATTYAPNGLGALTSQVSPDTGSTSYTYDAKGNVLSMTDGRGKVTQYSYDGLDRLTQITYASGTPTGLEYDGGATPTPATKGELTQLTDGSGSLSYAYDAMGRLTTKTQVTGGKTFIVRYTWGDSGSALDKLTAITYPSGSRVNYSYDAQGALAGVSVSPVNANGVGVSGTTLGLLSTIGYNADNQFKGWSWQNGTTQSISYDSFGQIASYDLGDAAGTGTAAGVRRTVMRDTAGRIVGFSHANNGSAQSSLDQSFGYDDLNRLLNANLSGTSTQYNYDATGNRTKKVVGATTYTNTIDPASNRVTQTQDVAGTFSIGYDAAGHITNDGVNSYTYSDRGRMSTATTVGGTVTYLYNGLELRVSKTGPTAVVPTGAAYYVYDEQGQLLGEYDATGTPVYETVYLGANPVGALKQTGTAAGNNLATSVYNVHADHLGAPRVITRASDRAIVWRWDGAESFGGTAPNQNPNALGVFTYNQRFPGQVFDAETGLFQNWHREYDPRQGRYRQSDPIGLAGGLNTFAYVGGNPLSYSDPEGLCPCGLPADVVGLARSDKRDWSWNADRSDVNSGFGAANNKCNLFADTQYEDAGYNLPNIGGGKVARWLGKYPPGAQSLAKPDYSVPGWPVVPGPAKPGDLIATGGHVGIATSPSTTISASGKGVVENDWGFRKGQDPVIRRCTCP